MMSCLHLLFVLVEHEVDGRQIYVFIGFNWNVDPSSELPAAMQ